MHKHDDADDSFYRLFLHAHPTPLPGVLHGLQRRGRAGAQAYWCVSLSLLLVVCLLSLLKHVIGWNAVHSQVFDGLSLSVCPDALLSPVTGDEGEFFPAAAQGLDGVVVTAVSAGDSHSLALAKDGRVFMCGTFRVSPAHIST